MYMQGEMLGEATEADREWHGLALAEPNIRIYILLLLSWGASDGFNLKEKWQAADRATVCRTRHRRVIPNEDAEIGEGCEDEEKGAEGDDEEGDYGLGKEEQEEMGGGEDLERYEDRERYWDCNDEVVDENDDEERTAYGDDPDDGDEPYMLSAVMVFTSKPIIISVRKERIVCAVIAH